VGGDLEPTLCRDRSKSNQGGRGDPQLLGSHKETRMKTRYAMWLAVPCLALSLGIGNAYETARHRPAVAASQDMIGMLRADGPHPSLGENGKIFGRLVGTWQVDYTDFKKDGTVLHRSGELLVGWVLDGRAIEDVWIVDPSGTRKEREIYADIRYLDSKSGTWPATFIDPEHASVARFTGGADGEDRIVLESKDFEGLETRWTFSEIRAESFVFRDEVSSDGGKTYRMQGEYHLTRERGAPASKWML
jgi:hypothetical protein